MSSNIQGWEIYLWVVTEDQYDKLREIEGCENLQYLSATINDREHILKIADELGIPNSNRFIQVSPTYKEVNATYMEIRKISK